MEDQKIPDEILYSLKVYNRIANFNRLLLIVLGLVAVISSTFVTAYVNKKNYFDEDIIQLCSFISTVTIAIISSFGLSVKGNNARSAYRLLLNAILLFKADLLNLEGLIKSHAQAETILGSVDFNSK